MPKSLQCLQIIIIDAHTFTWSTSLGLTNDPLLSHNSTCKIINNKVKSQSFVYEPIWPLSLVSTVVSNLADPNWSHLLNIFETGDLPPQLTGWCLNTGSYQPTLVFCHFCNKSAAPCCKQLVVVHGEKNLWEANIQFKRPGLYTYCWLGQNVAHWNPEKSPLFETVPRWPWEKISNRGWNRTNNLRLYMLVL